MVPVGPVINSLHSLKRSDGQGYVVAELQPQDRPFCVCVTRLKEAKDPEDVIMVLAEATRRVQNLAAVLVRDGTMRPSWSRRCGLLDFRTISSSQVIEAGSGLPISPTRRQLSLHL